MTREIDQHIRREIKLSSALQRVPQDLDALVEMNRASIEHATTSRQRAWSALSAGSDGILADRVTRLTADLGLLWIERRRLRMLLALRSRTHESYLAA